VGTHGFHCQFALRLTFVTDFHTALHTGSALTLWSAKVIIVPYRIIWSWYTGRWWVGCYILYSDEGTGLAAAPPMPILAVPNVTAHPSTASVPITVLLYVPINVPIKAFLGKIGDFMSQLANGTNVWPWMTLNGCNTLLIAPSPYIGFSGAHYVNAFSGRIENW